VRSCEIFQAFFLIQMTGGSERVKGHAEIENEFFHGLIGFIGSCEMEFEHLENLRAHRFRLRNPSGYLRGRRWGLGLSALCGIGW
jgi:hypothetical protein